MSCFRNKPIILIPKTIHSSVGFNMDDLLGELSVKQRILYLLFTHDVLTHGELADECGYKNKGRNKHRYVSEPLVQLEAGGYIEKTPGEKTGNKGAPPTNSSIKRDLRCIKKLYCDKELPQQIKTAIKKSRWVRDLIIAEHFKIESFPESLLEDLHKMLEKSTILFEQLLVSQFDINILNQIREFFIIPPENISEIEEGRPDECQRERILYSIYSYFHFCLLKEYFQFPIDKGSISYEVLELQGAIKRKLNDYLLQINHYQQTFAIMRGLKNFHRRYLEDENQILKLLKNKFERYQLLLEQFQNTGEISSDEEDKIIKELDDLYDSIASDLNIPQRRRNGTTMFLEI